MGDKKGAFIEGWGEIYVVSHGGSRGLAVEVEFLSEKGNPRELIQGLFAGRGAEKKLEAMG